MYSLKPIHHDSVEHTLAKAERYRLLNEPGEAESICLDILDIEPDNQAALVSLLLSRTDQIQTDSKKFQQALETAERLASPYDRAYYAGIAWERRAKARFHAGGHSAPASVYEWIVRALRCFESAEELRPPGNDDAVLRWNTCVRFLQAHPELRPHVEEAPEPVLSE